MRRCWHYSYSHGPTCQSAKSRVLSFQQRKSCKTLFMIWSVLIGLIFNCYKCQDMHEPLDTRTDMLICPSSCIPKALRMSYVLSQAYLALLWRLVLQRIHSRILPYQNLGKTQRTLICSIFSLSFVNSLQLLQNLHRIRIEIPCGCTEISDFFVAM